MTLQEVYDKYVKGNTNLKEVEIVSRNEMLDMVSISIKTDKFFGIDIIERGKEVAISDKSSYYDLDNAQFEVIHDPYEKDFGFDEDTGPIIATIQFDILKITLPQRELLLSDYQEALEIAKTRNKELEKRSQNAESEVRATKYFYEHAEQTWFHDKTAGAEMTKYIYELHFCGRTGDEIQECIINSLMYALLNYDDEEVEELRKMMIDIKRKDELADYITELLDDESPSEDTIRSIYDLSDDEYLPENNEITKDYLDEVRDLFVVKASIKDIDSHCMKFNSYSQALEKMNHYRQIGDWPQLAIHEVKIVGDGTSERTLVNLNSFMFNYVYDVNKKEE